MLRLILSYFVGIASGLLGIGCGVLIVPILVSVADMPIHLATATSMFSMIFITAFEALQHYFYFANQTNLQFATLLILGTTVGACIGIYASKRISGKTSRNRESPSPRLQTSGATRSLSMVKM